MEPGAPFRVDTRRHTLVHQAMAATFTATLIHDDPGYARQAVAAAWAELDRLEGLLSRFVESSDISRINALGPGQSTAVHGDTVACLGVALAVHGWTGGAFDVAYGSCGPWSPRPRFELDNAPPAVRVLEPGVRLDLGGIGKGFALDRMAAILADWDVEASLLAASTSTLLGTGSPAGNEGWPVVLGPERKPQRVFLKDRALSGSGVSVRGGHIVDPRTGRHVARPLRAWAAAPSAAMADALSTAFMVMSQTEVREFCRRHPTVAAWRQETPEDVAS